MTSGDGEPKRCPECGRDVKDKSVPRPPSLYHWRYALPLIVPVAIVAFVAWLKHGEVTRQGGSGIMTPMVVEPGVDIDLLRRIAEGEAQFDLAGAIKRAALRTVMQFVPGEPRLEVGFVDPQAQRSVSTTLGWPTSWYSRSKTRSYQDAARREGFLPAVTDPAQPALGLHEFPRDPLRIPVRDRWMFVDWGTLRLQPPPEETGGAYVTSHIFIRGIIASTGFVILAWWAAGTSVFIANRMRKKERRVRGMRVRVITVVLAFAAVLIAGIGSSERLERVSARVDMTDVTQPGSRFSGNPRTTGRLGFVAPVGENITPARLRQVAEAPDGDAETARRILQALDEADMLVPSDRYLAAVFQNEAVSAGSFTTWREDFRLLTRNETLYERHASFEGPINLTYPAGFAVERSRSMLRMRWAPEDPTEPTVHWTVNLDSLGTALVWLALLWIGVWTICWGVPAIMVRRRVRLGRCGGCGYIVRHVSR